MSEKDKTKESWVVDREGYALAMRICVAQKWYVFPWSRFVYAEGNGDEIKAAFATHDVTLRGEGLWKLLDYIQNQKLVEIQASPRSEKFGASGGTAVYEIIVKSVDEK